MWAEAEWRQERDCLLLQVTIHSLFFSLLLLTWNKFYPEFSQDIDINKDEYHHLSNWLVRFPEPLLEWVGETNEQLTYNSSTSSWKSKSRSLTQMLLKVQLLQQFQQTQEQHILSSYYVSFDFLFLNLQRRSLYFVSPTDLNHYYFFKHLSTWDFPLNWAFVMKNCVLKPNLHTRVEFPSTVWAMMGQPQ